MRTLLRLAMCSILIALFLAGLLAAQTETETIYFAIEVNGVVCGYTEVELSPIDKDSKELIQLEQHTFALVSALGAEFDTDIKLVYHIDPETGQFTYFESDVKQGQVELWSKVYVEGEKIRFTSNLSGDKIIDLAPGVILENTLIFPHLIRDFGEGGLDEKTYDMFDVREAKVQKTTLTKVEMEKLPLAGEKFEALVLDVLKPETGLKYRVWIDTKTGYLLKADLPSNRMSYRSGESIKKRIRTADLDETILASVDVSIPDFHSISYMKVRAKIEPIGLQVSEESLNVPGQHFTGTVENNLIDGVFEIEHELYDGSDPPPFPPDFGGDESLREYLDARDFIESDDPVLVEKAVEITKGSRDSWEAAVRLSEWVAENIGYAIPGGGTARKTFDIRAGECGAHSFLLAAFCRSVGIPARVVWGCMYVTNRGGSFGQHGWNEIYMGEAGWIPVDATVMETRHIDSGHIRFGEYQSMTTSFNPHEMEILDYRMGSEEAVVDDDAIREEYVAYLGSYEGPREGVEFEVFVQDGNLTVDIPGQIALPFSAPDEDGIWHCKLSPRLYLEFEGDDDGEADVMILHEIVTMPRRGDPEEVAEDVPEELTPYLGKYLFPQVQAEFTVVYHEDGLAVHDPLEDKIVKLQPPDESGGWLDEYGKNTIYFEVDDRGKVTALKIDAANRFVR
jgi:transglutaminase-like putative cysteine protease